MRRDSCLRRHALMALRRFTMFCAAVYTPRRVAPRALYCYCRRYVGRRDITGRITRDDARHTLPTAARSAALMRFCRYD